MSLGALALDLAEQDTEIHRMARVLDLAELWALALAQPQVWFALNQAFGPEKRLELATLTQALIHGQLPPSRQ